MRNTFALKTVFAVTVLCLGLAASAPAGSTIYDNTTNDLVTRFNPGTLEVGDEILLAGTDRYLTSFSFQFWGTATNPYAFAGSPQARVRFYDQNGPLYNGYPTPGTVLFDSGLFAVGAPTPASSFVLTAGPDFPAGGLFLPTSDLTWSVQFSGQGTGDALGVSLFSPPTVGASYPDYWQYTSGWWLQTNSVPMDFGARMEASATGITVPEPSVWLGITMLSAIGIRVAYDTARRIRRR